MNTDELIDAAEAIAALYDGDDRQDIKTDVMNAFYAGAKYGATVEREACAKVCDARYMGDNNREDMEARRCADAIRKQSNGEVRGAP